jgi:tRNA pseudouridine38-40 synthase
LPAEISVQRAALVEPGYDPRHHALRKTYRYLVLTSALRDPFLAQRAWRVGERLNQPSMRAEAAVLIGEHDFRAFRGAADERENTVRHIVRAEVRSGGSDERLLSIEIEGDRFLYRMIRIITGTLIDVGRGRLAPGAVARALASGAREDLGMTAPPDGLYLDHVVLDDFGRDAWPERAGAGIDGTRTLA